MESHTKWIDAQWRRLWRQVPCHAEFYRWVQWHNLAHVTGIEMGLKMKVIKYEDYNRDWRGTVEGLFRLLYLPLPAKDASVWEEVSPFLMRTYHDYYSAEQKYHIWKMVKHFASVPVWDFIQDYFIDEISVNVTKGDGGV